MSVPSDPPSVVAAGAQQATYATGPDLNSPEDAQAKYAEERDKRLRPEGVAQYVDLTETDNAWFRGFARDPWLEPGAPYVEALKDGSRCKYLICGAGFGGILHAVRLLQAGIDRKDIRIVDSAGGYGGTWYWNRYPGLMCDIESYIYMPLLEEMNYMPKHKYAYGLELRAYANTIADKWDLRENTMFQVESKSATWDDEANEWIVKMLSKKTGKGLTIRTQFLIAAGGVLNWPKIPDLPDIETFKGHSFHTSRWNYDYTGGSPILPSLSNLKDKRVGIIGTGATAVQAVPQLAKWAKELYVFQRTPSSVDYRGNHATDPENWNRDIANKEGWQQERNSNFNAHMSNVSPKPAVNMVGDRWSEAPSFSALIGGPYKVTMESIPAHIGMLHSLDLPRTNRVRARVDEIVQDRDTAQKLKAWYPTWCKRACFHDDYLPAFNQPNVTLVDTDGKGVDRLVEKGVIVGNKEYDLDLLIFSTGFRPPVIGSPGARCGMTVTGRHGESLDRKWAENVGTLHGVVSRGFPNFFFPGPIQAAAAANQNYVLGHLSTHIAYMISESVKRAGSEQKAVVEPSAESEEAWSMQIMMRAANFAAMGGCTPSYLNAEGASDRIPPEERMKAAKGAIWGEGIESYMGVIKEWRQKGELEGLEVAAAAA